MHARVHVCVGLSEGRGEGNEEEIGWLMCCPKCSPVDWFLELEDERRKGGGRKLDAW